MKNLTAEAIADITTTGSTLRDNHLRVLDDGLILRSQATLFVARAAPWDAEAEAALAALDGCGWASPDPGPGAVNLSARPQIIPTGYLRDSRTDSISRQSP